ncbi:MAG: DNA alkylation repair protein [Acholeplasmatales bacterium]|nr:MAG: DNA alkylation repair protein [Acholeplasmatales bacterium]
MRMNKDEVVSYMLANYTSTQAKATWLPSRKPTYGIRYPQLKTLSKVIVKSDPIAFLESNDFSLYELEILQTYVIGSLKRLDQALHYFKGFLEVAKEWSLIDSLCQKFIIAKKYPREVLAMIASYQSSHEEYTERMICVMGLSHYMIDPYVDEIMVLVDNLDHPGYYAKMGKAWAVCEYMVRYPTEAMTYIKRNQLDAWTHNKAIQKMLESYRIDKDLKVVLKTMKRK